MTGEEHLRAIEPETDLERRLLADPELREGLVWGEPRESHPEGPIAAHARDLLARIDAGGETGERRECLRFIAIVHDAFKHRVRDWLPKTGENHHAMRARRFAEGYTDDERILATIELHDRPYSIWRKMQRKGRLDERAWEQMMSRVQDRALFLRFIELDGSTEGKKPEPIAWFRDELARRYDEAA